MYCGDTEVSMGSSSVWMRVARAAALHGSFALALAAVGCTNGDDDHDDMHDEDGAHDEEAAVGPPSGATCPENSDLSYESFGKPFMEKYCTGCHSSKLSGAARHDAPEDHDFDSYEGIIGVAEHIDQMAAAGPKGVNDIMPPLDPRPAMEEREKLGQWLACELEMFE